MSEEPKQKEKLPKRVIIRYEHLNPVIRDTIKNFEKDKRPLSAEKSLISTRRNKSIDFAIATALQASKISPFQPINDISSAFWLGSREAGNLGFKLQHEKLILQAQKHGLLDTKFEGHYEDGWMDPKIISKSYPSFFVNYRGDLVFLRDGQRDEYYRYKFQEKTRKIGFGYGRAMWRYRAFLRPPTAPETVRSWAKSKVQAVLEKARKLKPEMVPRPVPVPVRAFKGRN